MKKRKESQMSHVEITLNKNESDDFVNVDVAKSNVEFTKASKASKSGMRNMNSGAAQEAKPEKKKGFFKKIFTRKKN